jgi:hypothetical protein
LQELPSKSIAVVLHYCHRFDPHGLSGEEREMLTREAKICLDTLRGQSGIPHAQLEMGILNVPLCSVIRAVAGNVPPAVRRPFARRE